MDDNALIGKFDGRNLMGSCVDVFAPSYMQYPQQRYLCPQQFLLLSYKYS